MMTRKVLAVLLAVTLVLPGLMFGQAKSTPCRFETPPTPDYYSRSYTLAPRVIRDVVGTNRDDSDRIINSDPQSSRGFKISWLQPNWKAGVLSEDTVIVMIGGSCESVRLTAKKGESVVYDRNTLDILAVIRCGNKVVDGKIRLAEEKIRIVAGQPGPRGEKGEKGDRGNSITGQQGIPGRDGKDGIDGKDGKPRKMGKVWAVIGIVAVIAGLGAGLGMRGKGTQPAKTYPTEGVKQQ